VPFGTVPSGASHYAGIFSVVLIVILLGLQHVQLHANTLLAPRAADDIARSPTLQEAQRFLYNGDYETATTIRRLR
jgi:hypothetical protein